jgi:DNA polymerase-3 subunit gamma/tau
VENPVQEDKPYLPSYNNIKKTSKIPSLKDLSQQTAFVEENDPVNVVEEPKYLNQNQNEAFGLQDLKKYWQDFADKKKLEGKNTEYILLNEDITLLEGGKIEIKLSNPMQEETLNSIKTEVLVFLRQKLQNDSITICSVLNTEERKRRLYTTREKFDYLTEKHPLLLELKERLGLDPDY